VVGLDVNTFLNLSELENLDAIELCDILWLSKYMKTDKNYYVEKEATNSEAISEKIPSKNKKKVIVQEPTKETTKTKPSIITIEEDKDIGLSTSSNDNMGESSYYVPHKGYFEDSNKLTHYLRGFNKKVTSKRKRTINEAKTVDYIANTHVTKVFFQPKKVKKYELYLTIDISDSMRLWEEMIITYSQLLTNSGVFRSVKKIYIDADNKETIFYRDKHKLNRFSINEVNNFHNNKLFFVLSDMESKAWKEGNAFDVFSNLFKKVSLFMVHMLPYRLWKSTALNRASLAKLKTKEDYPINGDYISELDHMLKRLNDTNRRDVKLPIALFELESLKVMGYALQTKYDNTIDGAVINLNHRVEAKENKKVNTSVTIDSFFANASREAQKLMISLAAVPLNIPIMRMIQEKVIKDTKNIYLAEVLNSKLLVKNGDFFKFINTEIHDELYKLLGREAALEIAYKNSDYIQENLNAKFGFKALLAGEVDLEEMDFSTNEKIFASISCKILKSLGVEYVKKSGCKGTKKIEAIIPISKRFMMGSIDSKSAQPIHEVVFNYDFLVSRYPVTVGEFREFVEDVEYITDAEKYGGAFVYNNFEWKKEKDAYWDNPYFDQSNQHPVVCITWNDADAYCHWLSEKRGEEYRLPTEAEWEFVCRAGSSGEWYFGNNELDLVNHGWYDENSEYKTHPVGEKIKNPWDLYDMYGNIWEWCEDDYSKSYDNVPVDGSAFYGKVNQKILRGGSWLYGASDNTSYSRGKHNLMSNFSNFGFRLTMTIEKRTNIIKNSNSFNLLMRIFLNSLSIDTIKIPNKNYEIGKYPITIAEYMHFARDTNSHYPEWIEDDTKYKNMNLSDNAPIIGVSWYDAVAYCEWLSAMTGKKYRLPRTEEEWIYAVNQDEEGIDSFGNTVSNADDYAWFYDNSGGSTHIVGEKQAYSLYIYDMYGNVREWTEDSEDNTRAGVCGGSWSMSKYDWHFDNFEKTKRDNDLGFRIILEIEEQKKIQKEANPNRKLEKKIIVPKQLTKILGSNIDFTVGRKKEVESIDSLLLQNNKILISGTGGIGKTTLVSMYLKKVQNNYNYVAYIRIEADFKQSIVSAFENSLNINENTLDNMYDIVINKLDRLKGKKLIVIDDIVNIDDSKILNEFLNTLDTWKIILVSRDTSSSIDTSMSHIVIDKLAYKEAKALLKSKVKKDISEDKLEVILKSLDYSPLLINKVAALIDNDNVSTDQILNMLGANKPVGKEDIVIDDNITKIKDWFLYNYKNPNAFPATFPIKFGKNDLQNFDAVKNTILSQFETQYDTDIIDKAINDIREEYGDIAWEKKSVLRVETKDGNIRHLDGDSYKEYVGPILNTKIHVPANGKVYEFEVNDEYYDIEIHKISEQTINESQATREMVTATGATHQGTIKFKDNMHGSIEELNKLIDEQFNKKYGLAFYSIIDDEETKKDYIDLVKTESEMEGWFSKNYDDPANFLPYDSQEGGFQYLYGGPYELDELLYEEFGERYPDQYIKKVIEGLEHQYGDVGWAKKPDENEGYVESDDPYDPKIREQEIKKMEADALEKAIEDREKELAKIQSSNEMIKSQINGDFNGWEGETIIKLMNGELWQQSEYYYSYHYAFMPKVTIINSPTGYKMKVDGIDKEVAVKKLENTIQTNIQGSFNGWDGDTIVELTNGEKWKQSSYLYSYSYAYNPEVIIYESDYGFKMKVDGNDEVVDVMRVQ